MKGGGREEGTSVKGAGRGGAGKGGHLSREQGGTSMGEV